MTQQAYIVFDGGQLHQVDIEYGSQGEPPAKVSATSEPNVKPIPKSAK